MPSWRDGSGYEPEEQGLPRRNGATTLPSWRAMTAAQADELIGLLPQWGHDVAVVEGKERPLGGNLGT